MRAQVLSEQAIDNEGRGDRQAMEKVQKVVSETFAIARIRDVLDTRSIITTLKYECR